MPLSDGLAPCNWCIDVEMYRIADELNLPPDASKVNLAEITQTFRWCIRCNLPFCSNHASPVDQSDACVRCLPFEDVVEMKTPLVSQDESGTHIHKGYRIVPTGAGYKTLPKAISELTDDELRAFITEKQNQITQIERQRDYLRTASSTAKMEQTDRDIAKSRALRGIKIKLPVADPTKGIKITGQKGTGPVKGVSGVGGQPFDVAAFLRFVEETKKNKVTGSGCTGASKTPSVPPSIPPTQMTAKVAPEHVAHNNSSVTAESGGGTPAMAPPPQTSSVLSVDVYETAREAEIEAIFNENNEEKNEN